MLYEVLVSIPLDKKYTYKSPKNLNIGVGDVVSVPFGKRQEQIGVVTSITQESDLKYPITSSLSFLL